MNDHPGYFKILIGNKDDLPERAISEEEANDCAIDLGAFYMETSAKDNRNVERMFLTMATEMLSEAKKSLVNTQSPGMDLGRGRVIAGEKPLICC
jgi:Ras-related protein Rab-8A